MAEPKGREGTATAYQNAILSNPATLATLAVSSIVPPRHHMPSHYMQASLHDLNTSMVTLPNCPTSRGAQKQRAEMKTYGSTQATKSFFQGGQVSQSENGVKNAEAFYRLVRPFEGLPRVLRPSLTTESGDLYGCYMNRN